MMISDIELPQGTNLYASIFCRRDPRSDIERLVEIFRVDQIEASKQLLGFGKRAVVERGLPIAHANRRCRMSRMERFGGD